MPRRGNAPGNSAVRGYSRTAIFRTNRNIYNRMSDALERLKSSITEHHRRNIKARYVMSVRNIFGNLLPINTIKSFDKLKIAYNAVKAERNLSHTRILRTRNPNNVRLVNGRIVVINPGNIIYKENIKNNIKRYKAGNRRALNKWNLNSLAGVNWNIFGGEKPFIKINGVWYRTENLSTPLTKKNIIENINLNSARLRTL